MRREATAYDSTERPREVLITVETARTYFTPHDPIPLRTLRMWIADGRLPKAQSVGRRVYLRASDLARVLGLEEG